LNRNTMELVCRHSFVESETRELWCHFKAVFLNIQSRGANSTGPHSIFLV
jgi:hypothetical protein